MVNKLFYGVIILLIIIGGIWGYFYFFKPSDQLIIKHNLEKLAEAASKKSGSGTISLVANGNVVDKLIADNVSIQVGYAAVDSSYSKYTFSNQIMKAKTVFSELTFTVYDCNVELSDDKTSATVSFTGAVKGVSKRGQKINEVKDVVATAEKNADEKWQFSKFSLQKVVYK